MRVAIAVYVALLVLPFAGLTAAGVHAHSVEHPTARIVDAR